ncbi:MAG: thiamine pyrophosphate-binding protein [Chloroflexi bacterium]|nr:thiamine pyrophosphate-binding protein [Chloroflexota bacterium]
MSQLVEGGWLAAKALKAEGVRYVFVVPVTSMASYYEGCEAHGIKVIGVRHEQAAAMAADGWARVTGRPGVAMFTSGPGFTNAYTGIANAYLTPSPALYIGRGRTNPAEYDLGDGMELDKEYLELMRPVTKWCRICYETKRFPEYISIAFRHALAGRPGPVYLEAPTSVLRRQVDESEVSYPTNYRTEARAYGDPGYVRRAAELFLKAERPVVMAGGGVHWSQASEELQKFVKAVESPAFLNALGRGSVPPTHPMYFGYTRSAALKEADVVMVVGAPLDWRLGHGRPPAWSAGAKVIQIDVDPVEIGRNRHIDVGIIGDPKAVLSQLIDEVGGRKRRESDWLARLREVEARDAARDEEMIRSDRVPIHPMRVLGELRDLLGPEDIIVGDGGFFVNFAARVMKIYKSGHWLDPGYMGCLGVGPGFAMAAKLAHPDKRVVLLSGDGSFGFNGMELDTMSRYGINVVTIVGNNGSWGMEKHSIAWKSNPIAVDLVGARYDIVAQGLGCQGERVEHPEQIRPALERALNADRPALVDVVLTDETQVYLATARGTRDRARYAARLFGTQDGAPSVQNKSA